MNASELLSRLQGVRKAGNGWTARCPAHDDRRNSLSVTERDGKLLVHCFAGCTPESIAGALGLSRAELFGSNGEGRRPMVKAQAVAGKTDGLSWLADYCGVPTDFLRALPLEAKDGHVVFRFGDGLPEKRRRVGAKDFAWDPPGAPTPPLWPMPSERLPESIWLCEGETDAIVARRLGLEAYGVTKGAGTPLKVTEAEALKRRGAKRVNVLFDADTQGRDGAKRMAEALAEAGLEVATIDLAKAGIIDPLGGRKDLRDAWLACRDAETLRMLLEKAIPDIPDSRSLRNRESGIGNVLAVWQQSEPPPRHWLVPDLLPEGCISLWYGDAGVFKSYLATALGMCLAAGRPFLGRGGDKPYRVLYVDTELDANEFVRRAYALARGMGLERPPVGLFYYHPTGSLADYETLESIDAIRLEVGADLVIVDSLSLGAYGTDMSAADVTTRIMAGLKRLGTVLAIDHIAKPLPGANLSGYRPFGSQFKWADARCITQVLKAESGEGVVLRPAKSNFGALGQPIGVKVAFEPGQVTVTSTDVSDLDGVTEHLPKLEQVAMELAKYGSDGAEPSELAEALEMSEKTVRNHLAILRKQERAEPVGGGRWHALTSIPDSRLYIGNGNRESLEGAEPTQEPFPERIPDSRCYIGTGNREKEPRCGAGYLSSNFHNLTSSQPLGAVNCENREDVGDSPDSEPEGPSRQVQVGDWVHRKDMWGMLMGGPPLRVQAIQETKSGVWARLQGEDGGMVDWLLDRCVPAWVVNESCAPLMDCSGTRLVFGPG